MHVLHQFGLDKVINQHPQGLDMQLGENGLGLSGGQKQLIALARLTLRDPQVVLLDEPTTGLDQETELSALDALQNWAKQRTLLVVTHRPQVLALVDRIIVMENGAIAMDGPKEEILAKLVQQQPQNIPPAKPRVHRVSVSARIRK